MSLVEKIDRKKLEKIISDKRNKYVVVGYLLDEDQTNILFNKLEEINVNYAFRNDIFCYRISDSNVENNELHIYFDKKLVAKIDNYKYAHEEVEKEIQKILN